MANSEISKWIKFRREFIESMPIDERKQIFPESLEDGYSWEAAGIADYIRVHMPHLTQRAPDVVESAASVSIFPASEVSASESDSTPATTQVM